jgi:hypothetical protein
MVCSAAGRFAQGGPEAIGRRHVDEGAGGRQGRACSAGCLGRKLHRDMWYPHGRLDSTETLA